jgi:hypothetical protein
VFSGYYKYHAIKQNTVIFAFSHGFLTKALFHSCEGDPSSEGARTTRHRFLRLRDSIGMLLLNALSNLHRVRGKRPSLAAG